MSMHRVGIIGGSGLGDALAAQVDGQWHEIDTPFGPPSGRILTATWESVPIAFVSRHGPGHLLNPSTVPYRANIHALKSLGVTHILASGATGSLREEIEPRHLVICDQVIDRTFRRASTFFDDGLVAHVEFAEPFCPTLRAVLNEVAAEVSTRVHPAGTYVCMEGPQFSTIAEAEMHRAWGGDLIGMTCMPEAKLAREAEICYALVALPTDYDCWRPHDPSKSKQALLAEIIGNLEAVTRHGIELLRAALRRFATAPLPACTCQQALEMAIWSDKNRIAPVVRHRLALLLDRHLPAD
ncbi:MAG: S-methyl-5'-thioadenosine phosphorylase [Phycisphaerae bacterium]|nr:S-methyl-5'-thioadenosine phosphorylase [Phycisphaerae bacterium]